MALQTVVSEAKIAGFARKEKAWEIISDFSKYPKIMDNIDDVKIIEKSATEGKSEWDITIEDAPFSWLQKDVYDHESYKIEFRSLSGDFDIYKGSWLIEDIEDGSIRIAHKLTYELGIPVIEEVLSEVLKKKMMGNLESVVNAIKKSIADSSFEERRFARETINAFTTITSGEKHYRIEVKDLGPSGMRISKHENFLSTSGAIEIGTYLIEVGELVEDINKKTSRILFAHTLNNENFSDLVAILKSKKSRKTEVNEKVVF